MNTVVLDGESLTMEMVWAVAVQGVNAVLGDAARTRVQTCHEAVKRLVAEGEIAYGITTGFGAFKKKLIRPDQTAALQVNLLRSHAAGVGPLVDAVTIRAMLLVRANTLAKGHSGVRPVIIDTLLAMLHEGVYPVVPQQGSLGASGDLAPLAHLALVLIGEGEAVYQGERMTGGEAMARAGITPVTLLAKEGLALLNGTAYMTALGALTTYRAERLVTLADVAGAMSLEAMRGTPAAFDARLVMARPHPRAIDAAAHLRKIIAGSTFLRPHDPTDIQDAYSLRCMPQVHGAVRDSVAYANWVLNIELNSANDNPLVFVREDGGADVISGGNFHGAPVAMAMDYLAMALADLASISERRQARLVDPSKHDGALPLFLTEHGGLENGLMIAQYTAASLVSENKVLAHPAVVDNLTTSADVEDHVSMGATSTRQAHEVLVNAETVIAIELLTAAQAVDFRRRALPSDAQMGPGTQVAYDRIRERVQFWDHDHVLAPDIEAVRQIVADGSLMDAVTDVIGNPKAD